MFSQGQVCAECPSATTSVRTVKGVQVDGEAIGLPEALATVPADIGLVPGVGPHVAGQLDGLGKHSITVLARVHFSWKYACLLEPALNMRPFAIRWVRA